MNYCIVDKRTPSLRGEVLGADTTGPAVARVGTPRSRESVHLGKNMTPIWKYCLAKFYFINLSIHQDPKNNWRVPFKIHFFAHLSLVSFSLHPRSRRDAEWIDRVRGVGAAPRRRRSNDAI